MKRFLGNTDKYYALIDAAGLSLTKMALTIILARITHTDTFATYILMLTVSIIWANLPNSFIVMPMLTVAPGLEMPQRLAVIHATIGRYLRWYGIAILVALCFTPLSRRVEISPLIYLGFCASIAMNGMATLLRANLQCVFCMKRAMVADIIASLILLVSVGAAWWWDWEVMAIFWWANAASWAVACVIMSSGIPRLDHSIRPPAEALARIYAMGWPSVTGSLANTACSRLQPFVLAVASGPLAVGLFGIANTFIGPIRMLAMAMNGVLRPRLALHYGGSDRAAVRRSLFLAVVCLAAVGITITIVFAVAGQKLAVLVFGEGFQNIGSVLPIAAFYALIDAMTACLIVAMQTCLHNGTRLATKLRIFVAALSLAIMWPACAKYGASGAFGGILLAECIYLAASIRSLYRPLLRKQEEPVPVS